MMARAPGRRKGQNLVEKTTHALREMVFSTEPGALLGSLHDLARLLDVGIVTLQQSARVLEHEGLLEVRRGPGGGYFGRRPDDAALERALSSYLRMHPATYEEALDITSILFNEFATKAAHCTDPDLREELRGLLEKLEDHSNPRNFVSFEMEFQDILFRMVQQPFFEMLTRVTINYSRPAASENEAYNNADDMREFGISREAWIEGRRQIISAILNNDAELTRFETNRHNRLRVLAYLQGRKEPEAAA